MNWQFIKQHYQKMPPWVRVLTFLLILVLNVYLTLLPNFISGECFMITPEGGQMEMRGLIMKAVIGGHTIKTKIDEDGVWTFPMVSKMPKGIEFKIDYNGYQYPVFIPYTRFWSHNKIYFEEKPSRFYLADESAEPSKTESGLWNVIIPGDLYAGESQPQDTVWNQGDVSALVKDNISKIYGIPRDSVKVVKTLGSDDLKRIRLIKKLQNGFDIKITDEEWERQKTVDDMIKLVNQKVKTK